MAISRLNFTNRKRLKRSDIGIVVQGDPGQTPRFTAILDLAAYDLPADSRVFIEAYRRTTMMRFPYGTVAVPPLAKQREKSLDDFQGSEGILFRVKVVSASNAGRLLANAEGVPPTNDVNAESDTLLPIRPDDNLGDEIWKLEINSTGATLLVNRQVGDWKAATGTEVFSSLVYPVVLRQVLTALDAERREGGTEDADSWAFRWLQFAVQFAGQPREDSWSDWVDEVVSAFARQHRLLTLFRSPGGEVNQ